MSVKTIYVAKWREMCSDLNTCNEYFWVCQVGELPPIIVVITFLIFDLIILGSTFLLYHHSINETIFLSKNYTSEGKQPSKELNEFLTGIKYNYVGLFLISINIIISHSSLLWGRNHSGYFLSGYYSIFSSAGISLILLGGIVFQRFYTRNQISGKSSVVFILIISILSLTGLIFGSIWRVMNGDAFFQKSFVEGFFSILIIFIGFNIYYLTFKIEYSNSVANARKILTALVYAVTILLFVLGLFFIPSLETPITDRLLNNSSIELLLLLMNIYTITVAYLMYLIVVMPKWLQYRFNISEDDMREFHYEFLGIKPFTEVILQADYDEVNVSKSMQHKDLHQGFILFSNFKGETNQKLTDVLYSRTEIIENFDIKAVDDEFYYDELIYRSNEIYLLHEVDERIYSLMDGIYEKYDIEIEIVGDSIYFNRQMFMEENYEYAIVFSGIVPKSIDKRMYMMLFPQKLADNMIEFLDQYFNFLEDNTFEGWYVMLLIFEKDDNGEILSILPNPDAKHSPNPSNFEILN